MIGRRWMAAMAALSLAAAPGTALAQAARPKPAPAAPKPTKAEVERGAYQLRVIMSALQSDKIDQRIKDVLFGCLYDNSVRKISTTVDQAITAQGARVDRNNPNQVLGVIAGVCGYRPPAVATPAKPKK